MRILGITIPDIPEKVPPKVRPELREFLGGLVGSLIGWAAMVTLGLVFLLCGLVFKSHSYTEAG